MFADCKILLVQLWYSLPGVLLNACTGIYVGWSSAAIPELTSGELGYVITSAEAAWVVAFLNVGNIISSICAKYVIDNIGRRWTIILTALPNIIGWVIIKFGRVAWHLYVGRFVGGIGYGIGGACMTVYLGEIADKSHRGGLLSMVRFMSNVGYLIAYVSGALLNFDNTLYVCATIPAISFIMAIAFAPESPYQTIKNGDINKARKLLMKLRSTNDPKKVEKELEEIAKTVAKDMENNSSFKELLTNPIYRKSLIINLSLRIFQNCTGYFVIGSYLQTILDGAGFKLSASISSIMYGILQCIFGPFATLVVDRFGRRPLLISSFTGIIFCLTSIGVYFFIQDYIKADQQLLDSINWIPLAGVIVFCFCYNTGIGAVVHVIAGETFQINIKATAISFCNVMGAIISIAITKGYQMTSDAWGVYVPFWILAVVMIGALIFTFKYIPETKNQTFDEIQSLLQAKRNNLSRY